MTSPILWLGRELRMLARNPKWQNVYDLSCDVGGWPLGFDNLDRIRFSKWCQFYKRLMENYEEEERPTERILCFDVLVDNFLREDKARRDREKMRSKSKHKVSDEGLTIG